MAEVTRLVSFVDLKRLAITLLPRSSHLRAVILAQPDFQPREKAFPKLEVLATLMREEFANQ